MNARANPWDRRIQRAQILEREHPASAEILRRYLAIASFQKQVSNASLPGEPFTPNHLPEPLHRFIPPLLNVLESAATAPCITRILLQPYAEQLARRAATAPRETSPACPFCHEPPVAAILRPEGEGGKRSLLCSLCFTEWEFRRLLCPHCAEEDPHKLPVYTAEEFPHIRVEACDVCRTYIKAIDLTRNGLAVPEVDELASVSLDLWAADHGYAKLYPNLFGL